MIAYEIADRINISPDWTLFTEEMFWITDESNYFSQKSAFNWFVNLSELEICSLRLHLIGQSEDENEKDWYYKAGIEDLFDDFGVWCWNI